MSEKIIITIPAKPSDQEVKIEVKGLKGKSCRALTKPLVDALGGGSTAADTDEANQQETKTTNKLKAGF